MDKKKLYDAIMVEYYYENNTVDDTIEFLTVMLKKYQSIKKQKGQTMEIILLLGALVLLINAPRIKRTHKPLDTVYICTSGDFKGQTHDLKTWRKIGQEITSDKTLRTRLKYSEDEEAIGLLLKSTQGFQSLAFL